jgi:hypothetical protein
MRTHAPMGTLNKEGRKKVENEAIGPDRLLAYLDDFELSVDAVHRGRCLVQI